MNAARGVVISVHHLGATVRLAGGSLAAVPATEVEANRARFVQSLQRREELTFRIDRRGRHAVAYLADSAELPAARALVPAALDPFEERMNAYLKETEEWAPPDQPPPAERHFIRKKRRAAYFEARTKGV